jgi:hypothetical protein
MSSPRPPRAALACIVVAAAAVASCGHGRLVPAADARLMADTKDVAVAGDGGVRVVASLDDWRGLAGELPAGFTPIKLRVVNHAPRPVAVLYEHLALEGRKGRRYLAVPAIPLDHAQLLARNGPITPIFAAWKFEVAARYHDIYPALDAWPVPLTRDDQTYERAYREWNGSPPGPALRRLALPEGVLAPDGEVTGYVFFESPIGSESTLTLDADLVSDGTGDRVASIRIPLRVD